MSFELKEGQGTFFRNDKKTDKQPDYRGEVLINGVLCEIAGWIKEGQRGKWMSLNVKPKEQKERPVIAPSGRPVTIDDDIPFR